MAKGLGVTEDKIKVDYDSKEVTIDTDAESADMKALAMALKDSGFSMAGM